MLIQQFCMTFITMTEKKKERERKVLGIRQQKSLLFYRKLKKLKPFTTNNKNKVLKGINKFVQEVCNYGKQQL